LDLNPPGRTQNKKFRPMVPVTPTLLPWLRREVGPSGRYVSYRSKGLRSILHMWRLTRADAGLDKGVTPYSIRHGLAREMRKRRVPTEQISLFLGHLPDGSAATTSIYACPYRELDSSIAMMQPADHGLRNDATKRLDWSAHRRILG